MLRAALQIHREHPEITFRRDALLCSINERMGQLLRLMQGYAVEGHVAGTDVAPLSGVWVEELVRFHAANVEEALATKEEHGQTD